METKDDQKPFGFLRKTRKLSFRLSFLVFILIVLAFLAFSIVFLYTEKNKLSEDILNDGIIFSEFTTPNAYDYYQRFYLHSRPEMIDYWKQNMKDLMSKNKDVARIQIISTNGKILSDTIEIEQGKYADDSSRYIDDPISLGMIKTENQTYRKIKDEEGDGVEIFMPVIEETGWHIISARYIIRYHTLNRRMMEVYSQTLLTLIPIMIITLLLVIPFALRITNPIQVLTAAVKKLSAGNYNPMVEDEIESKVSVRDDEVGELYMEFKSMTEVLKKSREMLENSNKELESKVEERTKELKSKNEELEKFNKVAIGRELKIVEMKKKVAELEAKLKGQKSESQSVSIENIKKKFSKSARR
ncbi:HAMP domain-containing protein [Candidatus Woesearchaeota archaeon]|nr:HAMP domain-containing protein [Candidatus Woesearchaeota archaeon]